MLASSDHLEASVNIGTVRAGTVRWHDRGVRRAGRPIIAVGSPKLCVRRPLRLSISTLYIPTPSGQLDLLRRLCDVFGGKYGLRDAFVLTYLNELIQGRTHVDVKEIAGSTITVDELHGYTGFALSCEALCESIDSLEQRGVITIVRKHRAATESLIGLSKKGLESLGIQTANRGIRNDHVPRILSLRPTTELDRDLHRPLDDQRVKMLLPPGIEL